MKQRLTPLAIGLCLMGMISMPVYAASADQSAQIQALQQQLSALQEQVSTLKSDQPESRRHRKNREAARQNSKVATTNTRDVDPLDVKPNSIPKLISEGEAGQKTADQKLTSISGPSYLPETGIQYLPIDVDVPGQSFVSTGPYIGVPLQFSGSDLIINSPNVNEDVLLLKLRKNINKRLADLGLKTNELHSHLLLSGTVEGQANYINAGGSANSTGIDLTNVGIDAYILTPSTWVSGLISLNYDNNIGANDGSLNSNSRSANSHIFVNKAFITIGNFAESPFYGTIGQMFVPFGVYSSSLVSSPITKLLFRTQQRAALIGVQQQGKNAFYGSGYIFNGDSHVGSVSRLDNGGINMGYRYDFGCFSGDVGAGAIASVADSQGMQGTGSSVFTPPGSVFTGFGGTNGTGNEHLVHRVPGYDFRGLFSLWSSVDLLAEYITASTSFNPTDLTMKSHGAKPQALNTEAAYTFQSFVKPTSITLGYAMSKDAVVLAMPAQRYSVVLNTSWWRNTLESLEFRHDINYAISAASTSYGSTIPGPTLSGRNDNIVTAQFDIYF